MPATQGTPDGLDRTNQAHGADRPEGPRKANEAERAKEAEGAEGPNPTELMILMRALSVETDRFAERFAAQHGLHRTDLNALVVILDAARAGAPLTPGGLGRALNLSPPATTALIDRLEQAGHVERRRSATDRRKVEVVFNEQAAALARRYFAPLARHLTAAIEAFSPEEREIIGRFLENGIKATAAAREEPTEPAPS